MEFKQIESKIKIYKQAKERTRSYWGCAIAGEVGELCNMIKKFERDGNNFSKNKYSEELADIFIYTSIISRILNIDLEKAILDKIKILEKDYGKENEGS